jgi:hypothetical protein
MSYGVRRALERIEKKLGLSDNIPERIIVEIVNANTGEVVDTRIIEMGLKHAVR